MIKISQFIEKRLFSDSGYYRQQEAIGKDADFITSPEISQIFGEIIAAYLLQIFSQNKPRKISLVEMGAGKGTLFFDVVNTITKLAKNNNDLAVSFLQNCQFHIIEINQFLRQKQQEKLGDFTIKWHENFDDFARQNKHEIFFISNELLDCFAIDQYFKTDIGWCERMVDEKKEEIKLANFDPKINEFVMANLGEAGIRTPFSAIFEISQTGQNFIKKLAQNIKKFGGIALNFDYGYVKNDFANTLQAIKNHQKVDLFTKDADISALVDFLALEKIAKNEGLNSSLISQKTFLTSLGIEERAENLIKNNPTQKEEILASIKRLKDEKEMGELFKCLILFN